MKSKDRIFPQFKESNVVSIYDWIMAHGDDATIKVLHMEGSIFLHSLEDNSFLVIKSPMIVNEEVE